MKESSHFRVLGLVLAFVTAAIANAQVNVVTEHNDVGRTGANLSETLLNTSNVNVSTFGKLFSRTTDGQGYAQPLYLSNVNIGGKVRNVVLAATMNDSLYCFDADDPNASQPLWHDSFINPPSVVPVPFNDLASHPISNDIIGILSTPVIDPASDTIFIVTTSLEGDPNSDASYVQRLHALDVFTGKEKTGSPVALAASVPGTGDSSNGTFVSYVAKHANQRPALLLLNGVVYISSASYSDTRPYHGWILAYSAATLKLTAAYCDTPDGNEGGIWMSGQGPSADPLGSIYVVTANGTFTADPTLGNGSDYGDSILKLSQKLAIQDFFTPFNQETLSAKDLDLGSMGVLVIPGTNLLFTGGKQGIVYLTNRSSMGHFNTGGSDSQIVQSLQASPGELHGSPVFWQAPSGGRVYLSGAGDSTKSFALVNGKLNTSPVEGTDASGNVIVTPNGPGGILSLSANGSQAGTGILWAQYAGVGHGTVRAFDASTMKELWNSEMNSSRDRLGHFGKFSPPTVANGKVYVSSFSNLIAVYGLLGGSGVPAPPSNLSASAGSQQVALTWSASAGATSYSVKRSLTSGSGYSAVKTGLTGTTYTDTGLTNGTTYYYVVTASNAKGESANSLQVSATPVGSGGSSTLTTIADTYTHSTTPTSTYGLGPALRTKYWSTTDQRRSYVKFDVSKLTQSIVSAKLRVYGAHLSSATVSVSAYAVADNSWTEQVTDWNNQPAIGNLLVTSSVGSVSQYYEWDVSAYLRAQKAAGAMLVTIALQENVRADGATTDFHSLQNGTNPPLLVVTW